MEDSTIGRQRRGVEHGDKSARLASDNVTSEAAARASVAALQRSLEARDGRDWLVWLVVTASPEGIEERVDCAFEMGAGDIAREKPRRANKRDRRMLARVALLSDILAISGKRTKPSDIHKWLDKLGIYYSPRTIRNWTTMLRREGFLHEDGSLTATGNHLVVTELPAMFHETAHPHV
jgi:hypothetical protein